MVKVIVNREALETAIARRNLSGKEFAYQMKTSPAHMYRLLGGKYEPSTALRQRMLDFFKEYTFDDLFTIQTNGNGKNS